MQWLPVFQLPYLYSRYKTLRFHFDFVAIEQLVLENVETDTRISNIDLLLPQML